MAVNALFKSLKMVKFTLDCLYIPFLKTKRMPMSKSVKVEVKFNNLAEYFYWPRE